MSLKSPSLTSSRTSTVLPCPSVPLPKNFSTLPLLPRSQIASRIAAGHLLVIHSPLVYRIPSAWLKLHPGGDLAILHYVGRDASNEIEAYHAGKTVKDRMSRWIIGRVDDTGKEGWRDMVPPVQLGMWPVPVPKIVVELVDVEIDEVSTEELESLRAENRRRGSANGGNLVEQGGGVRTELPPRSLTVDMVNPPSAPLDQLPLTPSYQNHLRKSHRALHAKIQSLGLDQPPAFLSGYAPSLLIYITLFLLWVTLYKTAQSTLGYVAAAVALGAWWHQITFVVHDAAHTGLTGNWWRDRVAAIMIADFMGGVSVGWWADNHNVHHRRFRKSLTGRLLVLTF